MSDIRETAPATSANVRYDSDADNASGGGDERHSLRTYVSDLLSLTKHIEAPISRQLNIEDSSKYVEAIAIINDIKAVLEEQEAALSQQVEALGGHGAQGIKDAWSGLLGAGAAAIDSVRKTKVSKSLRDDYTALNLAAVSYTMLHATALGIGETSVAGLAQTHLGELTPIIMRINRAIPAVVLQELRDDGEDVRVTAAELSAQTTQAAWQ